MDVAGEQVLIRERVHATLAAHVVAPQTRGERVVAVGAEQGVIAGSAHDHVVAAASEEPVGAAAADDPVTVLGPHDVLDRRDIIGDRPCHRPVREVDEDASGGHVGVAQRVDACVALDDVGATARKKGVVAVPASQHVVAAEAAQHVVTAEPAQHVGACGADQHVVVRRADDRAARRSSRRPDDGRDRQEENADGSAGVATEGDHRSTLAATAGPPRPVRGSSHFGSPTNARAGPLDTHERPPLNPSRAKRLLRRHLPPGVLAEQHTTAARRTS